MLCSLILNEAAFRIWKQFMKNVVNCQDVDLWPEIKKGDLLVAWDGTLSIPQRSGLQYSSINLFETEKKHVPQLMCANRDSTVLCLNSDCVDNWYTVFQPDLPQTQ